MHTHARKASREESSILKGIEIINMWLIFYRLLIHVRKVSLKILYFILHSRHSRLTGGPQNWFYSMHGRHNRNIKTTVKLMKKSFTPCGMVTFWIRTNSTMLLSVQKHPLAPMSPSNIPVPNLSTYGIFTHMYISYPTGDITYACRLKPPVAMC